MMSQVLIYIAAGFTATIAILFLLTENSVTVKREKIVDSNSLVIFKRLESNRGYQSINPYKTQDEDLKIELFGPDAGVGSGFKFSGKDGTGTQTLSASIPGKRVQYDIDLGAMGKSQQQIDLEEQAPGKTKVTWTMRMNLGYNPLMRVFGLFADKIVGPSFEIGLNNIASQAE
ncbi:MAG: SRPBCC family protein [Pseudomonadota bacterium]